MGRIKSALVKRSTKKMLAEENSFTEKFEDNKIVLGKTMPSKKVRNKIAGYLARLKRVEARESLKALTEK
ncbi:MAG: 30S ribosomal protein S17e [Nanoarchaeota archaeon]|nr:30S ribosomal protein S17e [Nanoarchaeota archaeon]MBU4086557.1 30S ribosomal protein S17e [Nanoarchaeota archaeon]